MFRVSDWLAKIQRRSLSNDVFAGVAIDLGSATTKVVMDHELVLHQPTCIALHQPSNQVIAVGQQAADLLGKTPGHTKVISPVRRAKVQDVLATQLYLQAIFQNVFKQPAGTLWSLRRVFRPAITFALAADTSKAEQEMIAKLFRDIGFSHLVFKPQLQAAYHHLLAQKKVGKVFALVNIGAMKTEMAFFTQHEIVVQRSISLGGDDFTRVVIQELQKQHHCQVGWQTAEKVKINLGIYQEDHSPKGKKMVVRGRDILTSLPATVQISAEEVTPAYQPLLTDLIHQITDLFQDAAPELMAEGLDQGVMLTGGGSLLAGLTNILEEGLQTPVYLSRTALEDVVRGL